MGDRMGKPNSTLRAQIVYHDTTCTEVRVRALVCANEARGSKQPQEMS